MFLKNRLLLGAGAAALALIVAAGALFWYVFLRDDAPPKVTLEAAVGSVATTTAPTTPGATAAATKAATREGINGAWIVATDGQTFVGYRVKEQLARVGLNTAVGRTSAVTAKVVIDNGSLTAATIEANLAQLKSDESLRDGQLRNQAIETNKFPTTTFTLAGPVALPDGLKAGQAITVTLKGTLTLHGVTKPVELPVNAQLTNGRIVAVGNLAIVFADYNISKPNGATVLSIEDNGVMEFQIVLAPS